jgi:hypothetical protein
MMQTQLKDEIRDLLIIQAKKKKTVSYGELCGKLSTTTLKPDDPLLHKILGELSEESHKAGRGLLSVVVTGHVNNLPGDGFFSMADGMGYKIVNRKQFVKDQIDDVHRKYRDPGILKM